MLYHIIYTSKNGRVISKQASWSSRALLEDWLCSIGATYWEIAELDDDPDRNDWHDGRPVNVGDS